jgi:hypothetical protein
VIELQILPSKKNIDGKVEDGEEIADPRELEDEAKFELLKALGIINDKESYAKPKAKEATAIDESIELRDGQTMEQYHQSLFWKRRVLLCLPFLVAESAYNMWIGYEQVKFTTFE